MASYKIAANYIRLLLQMRCIELALPVSNRPLERWTYHVLGLDKTYPNSRAT